MDVGKELGLSDELIELFGRWKAKVRLEAIMSREEGRGKLVLVTAMTPTPRGEGKTVTSIGLAMGLRRIGHSSVVCLRQPSLGPVFGVKGGATGGGKATVEPSDEINLGLTGDIDNVATAHNLLAAMIDNHLGHGNELELDPETIAWPWTMDMEDRALRQIVTGLGEKHVVTRETGFMITAASEVMAVLSLSRDYADLKHRLGQIIVGYTRDGRPVRAGKVGSVGAMAAVLRNALKPNLVQTCEGTPALVHGGCFGNIAHGTATVASILLGLGLAEYCVVEAGFGSDLGAEKFVDIAARAGGFDVDAAVVVASLRAIKYHGGIREKDSGSDLDGLMRGLDNLAKHIENVKTLGLAPVVAINKFPEDREEELRLMEDFCQSQEVPWALSTVYEDGGLGGVDLAEKVVQLAGSGRKARPLYPLESSVESKVETVVREMYGGSGIDFDIEARRNIRRIDELGHRNVPVCISKTPLSLSDDASAKGRPEGFRVQVHRVTMAAGAGFNVVYMGDVSTMPGLPKHPAAENIDLLDDGRVKGIL